jgi:hypothetical protein
MVVERRLGHENGEGGRFHARQSCPARADIEATGHTHWFKRLLAKLGHELRAGDPAKVGAQAICKQMTDSGNSVKRLRDALSLIILLSCPGWLGFAQSRLLAGWNLTHILNLEGPTNHVQGIDFEAQTAWVTSVDPKSRKGFLRVFSLDSGQMLRSVEIQDGVRFHPGGIAADATSVWIPVAEYRPNSTSVIQERDKRTLLVEFQFQLPDHIGCVAVTPEYLIGGNWDSRDFYVWDHKGRLIRKIASDTHNAYQDLKFDPPYLVASGLLPDHTGAIDWLEFPSLHLLRRVKVSNTERQVPLTNEGMAVHGDRLILLPEDEPSRLFIFRRKVE